MGMRGDLADGQRDLFRPAGFGQDETVAEVQRDTPAEVRQSEGRLSVASVRRADELKQRLVFRDGKQLTLAEHPSRGGEVAGEHANLSNVRLCHVFVLLLSWRWGKCPAGRSRS